MRQVKATGRSGFADATGFAGTGLGEHSVTSDVTEEGSHWNPHWGKEVEGIEIACQTGEDEGVGYCIEVSAGAAEFGIRHAGDDGDATGHTGRSGRQGRRRGPDSKRANSKTPKLRVRLPEGGEGGQETGGEKGTRGSARRLSLDTSAAPVKRISTRRLSLNGTGDGT